MALNSKKCSNHPEFKFILNKHAIQFKSWLAKILHELLVYKATIELSI